MYCHVCVAVVSVRPSASPVYVRKEGACSSPPLHPLPSANLLVVPCMFYFHTRLRPFLRTFLRTLLRAPLRTILCPLLRTLPRALPRTLPRPAFRLLPPTPSPSSLPFMPLLSLLPSLFLFDTLRSLPFCLLGASVSSSEASGGAPAHLLDVPRFGLQMTHAEFEMDVDDLRRPGKTD